MTRGQWIVGTTLAIASLTGVSAIVFAQSGTGTVRPGARLGRDQLPQPVLRVAQQLPDANNKVAANNIPNPATGDIAAQAQHPLVPALQIAYAAMNNIRTNIKDYSCTMMKRERVGGKLNDAEFMFLKVRQEPFSVYMYFLGPDKVKGQEALYVEGKNDGNLMAHGVGLKKVVGTVSLPPTGVMAMAGQRYPITEIGIGNLTKRLIEVAEKDKLFGECDVKFYKGAKINGRVCTVIQVMHPVQRKNFLFHKALVFVDDEFNIPVRYEAWDWPAVAGGTPELIEEYTYTNMKINNGFTDADFDDKNPAYNFH